MPMSRTFALLVATAALAGCLTGEEDEDLGMGQGLGHEGDDDAGGKADSSLGARVCATSPTTLRGVDVSKYQGTIDWAKVKNSGVTFGFIRVSDGRNTRDPKFATNWSHARAAGVVRGAYQFFRPTQDATAQAKLLVDALAGDYDAADLPPVIDVEVDGGLSPATVRARLQTWIDYVEEHLGRKPIIYSGAYFWRDEVGGGDAFARHPLWIAQYTSLCPRLPQPWEHWTFWQHADTGRVPGIGVKVDVNRFDGTRADLDALIADSDLRTHPSQPDPEGTRAPVEDHESVGDPLAFPR
jgi:lysozyme